MQDKASARVGSKSCLIVQHDSRHTYCMLRRMHKPWQASIGSTSAPLQCTPPGMPVTSLL